MKKIDKKKGLWLSVSKDGNEIQIHVPVEILKDDYLSEKKNFGLDLSRYTPRMHEILNLILEGKQNKEIANALNISVRTVKWHTRQILLTANVADRFELYRKYADIRISKKVIQIA